MFLRKERVLQWAVKKWEPSSIITALAWSLPLSHHLEFTDLVGLVLSSLRDLSRSRFDGVDYLLYMGTENYTIPCENYGRCGEVSVRKFEDRIGTDLSNIITPTSFEN